MNDTNTRSIDDLDGLAQALRAVTASGPLSWDELPETARDVWLDEAAKFLASGWLAERDERVRTEAGERIAAKIESELAEWNSLGEAAPGREADAQWFVNRAMQLAAKVARAGGEEQ